MPCSEVPWKSCQAQLPHDFPCGRCLRCWTAWCDAATFEKSSSGTTPNAREQLLHTFTTILWCAALDLEILFFIFVFTLLGCQPLKCTPIRECGNDMK